jgi:hypothetical protein
MSTKSLILIIVGICIIGISIIFVSNTPTQDVANHNTTDSPTINDSTTIDTNKPDSFINENGTKTYIINAIDNPVFEP